MLQITILHNSLTTAVQIFSLVDFLADLYINGESTFEIQEQGKMKTVTVDRSVYKLSKQATEVFKSIHDEWELDICEKNPYDNLIGGKSTVLMSNQTQQLCQHSNHKPHTSIPNNNTLTNNCLFYFPKITTNTIQLS